MSVAGLLNRAAHLWGPRIAVRDPDGEQALTFSDLVRRCLALGSALESLGAPPGSRIALIGDQRFDYLIADYGVMACGRVRVPLDPALSPAELAAQIRDADAVLILCSDSRRELGEAVAETASTPLISLEQLVDSTRQASARTGPQSGDRPDPLPVGFDALASLNYTGGTSSEPKAVMLTQGALRASVQNIVQARAIAAGEIMLNVRPLWPIAAIVVLAHLCAGGTVITAESFGPDRFASLLRSSGATHTSLVPTHLVRLLREVDRQTLRSLIALRSIDVGAAAIPPASFAELIEAIGPRIGVLYGLTEAPWSCYQPGSDLMTGQGIDPTRMRSAGLPVFGCDLAIASDEHRTPGAEEGEILLRGAHLMKGYWKKPALTDSVLRDGWLHTGDLGRVDASGRLTVTGRIKSVIRSGGKSVLPDEVEQVLRSHPDVADVAVFGLPDLEWGERVAAAVVVHAGRPFDAVALAGHCERLLSPHKRPRIIRAFDTLPRSHYGKVQTGKLRERFS